MKTLNSPVKFMVYSVLKALRHPRTPIIYFQCECGCRFPNSASECPQCKEKVGQSPESRQVSPVPWWGSMLCIVVGIGAWIASAALQIGGLDEAARALVYIPLGSLFSMSLKRD